MVVPVPFRQTYHCKDCGEHINTKRPSFLTWITPSCPACKGTRVVRIERSGCVILESGECINTDEDGRAMMEAGKISTGFTKNPEPDPVVEYSNSGQRWEENDY